MPKNEKDAVGAVDCVQGVFDFSGSDQVRSGQVRSGVSQGPMFSELLSMSTRLLTLSSMSSASMRLNSYSSFALSLLRRSREAKWICSSCQRKFTATTARRSQSIPKSKPFYVTSPIFYVNAGTCYQMIFAPLHRLLIASQPLMSATCTRWSLRTSSNVGRFLVDVKHYFVRELMSME
jgi:hypothetical protein